MSGLDYRFGYGLVGGPSDFDPLSEGLFVSVDGGFSVDVSDGVFVGLSADESAISDLSGLRESFIYHPDPLKTIPTG